ncbi:hypothetical protein Q5P01_014353 [Channa striata]|uniref:Uncharacterized protein n=1 Tax=Channa striata TaxID=64152 RepID=A0AA88SGM4_CHASR|nr:hypothetical protein Q5P01_014353 [Channa striata]
MLIKAVSAAITAANSSLSVTEINAPRSSSHLAKPEYLPSSQNLIKSSAPQTPLLHSLPTAQRWTRGLNFNLKIALNYFCGDHLPELLMWLSGKGLQQRQQAPRVRRTGTKTGEERQRERGMERQEGERMRAYIKATFSDICALAHPPSLGYSCTQEIYSSQCNGQSLSLCMVV